MDDRPWFQSYAEGVPRTVEYEPLTVSQALTRAAGRWPASPAMNYMGKRIDHAEFDGLVSRFARALLDLGVERGDRVALILPNLPQTLIANMAVLRAGAVVVQNNPLYTGDIGRFDEQGYLQIVDRKKDMIIAGGYNIYPVEIDNVLMDHPRILEACAVGLPDEYRGETVKAFVVSAPGAGLTVDEVTAYCKEKLAAYKVPKQIEFLDELPKSAVGKVLRRELRDRELANMRTIS